MQLSFEIDPAAQMSLQSQLVSEISTSITTGRLAAGTRLPGTRALSEQLGVSRSTVLLAFAALASEGFVETREGSGTFVSEASPEPAPFETPAPAVRQKPVSAKTATPVICDFKLEAVDPDLFPAPVWRRMMMRRMNSSEFNLTNVGDPQGYAKLRASLCRFLGTSRGMNIRPEQILIVSSIQQATNVVGQMYVTPGSPVIVERPGCSLIAPNYSRDGAEIIAVATDADGLRVDLFRIAAALWSRSRQSVSFRCGRPCPPKGGMPCWTGPSGRMPMSSRSILTVISAMRARRNRRCRRSTGMAGSFMLARLP